MLLVTDAVAAAHEEPRQSWQGPGPLFWALVQAAHGFIRSRPYPLPMLLSRFGPVPLSEECCGACVGGGSGVVRAGH